MCIFSSLNKTQFRGLKVLCVNGPLLKIFAYINVVRFPQIIADSLKLHFQTYEKAALSMQAKKLRLNAKIIK
jgi:hypothetical protein